MASERNMAARDDKLIFAPQLYRFARGLACSQRTPCTEAASLVEEVLAGPVKGSFALWLSGSNFRMYLYATLIGKYRDRLKFGGLSASAHAGIAYFHVARDTTAQSSHHDWADALMDLGLEEREALLLVAVEGFTYAQAARILKVSRKVVIDRLRRARPALYEIPPMKFIAPPNKARPPYLRLVK